MKNPNNCDDSQDIFIHEKTYSTVKKDNISEFSKLIKAYRSRYFSPTLKTRDLAAMVRIDYEMFRKILNMQKPTKKRDCIIAICSMLMMDTFDTSRALSLYNNMPVLNKDDDRDELLMEILDNQVDDPLSIEEIDECLLRSHFLPLDIADTRKTKSNDTATSRFTVLHKSIRTITDELLYGDPYDSLETEYDLSKYRSTAYMVIEDSTNGKQYRLTSGSDGKYTLETIPWDTEMYRQYNTVEETGIYAGCFHELNGALNSEHRIIMERLNDTRNYGERLSANLLNNSIHVFMEKYNYAFPEMNEYYLMEYLEGEYILSIYHSSQFMKLYLPDTEYKKYFRGKESELVARYTSLDVFDELIASQQKSYENVHILKHRKKMYVSMQQSVLSMINDLKNRRKFIRNLCAIYDDENQVCLYYNVLDNFSGWIDNENDIIVVRQETASFIYNDASVLISLEELKRAFELGFDSIEDICRIKSLKGTIEAIF